MQPVVSHADDESARISDSERHRRAYKLRLRFTGRTDIPAEHFPAMTKLFTLPLHPELYEADLLSLEALAVRLGIPDAEIPEHVIIL
jgi:hypothetical protein